MALRFFFRAALLAVVAALLAPASWAGTLLVEQVNPYPGYGYGQTGWSGMTSALNGAFGAANITVSNSPLTSLSYLMGFDALWITAPHPGAAGLSAAEISNVQAFIATGKRVVLTGENSAWATWDNSILSIVGGSYSGNDTSVALTPMIGGPLTAGVGSMSTASDGIATGGTPVFSQNVISLWGNQNALTILSLNIEDDMTGSASGNLGFKTNLATWLAASSAPEPSTCFMLAGGLALIAIKHFRRV